MIDQILPLLEERTAAMLAGDLQRFMATFNRESVENFLDAQMYWRHIVVPYLPRVQPHRPDGLLGFGSQV